MKGLPSIRKVFRPLLSRRHFVIVLLGSITISGCGKGEPLSAEPLPRPSEFSWIAVSNPAKSAGDIYEELYGVEPSVPIDGVSGAAVFAINEEAPDYSHPDWLVLEDLVKETCSAALDAGRILRIRAGVDASGGRARNEELVVERGEATRDRLIKVTCLKNDADFILDPHPIYDEMGPPDQEDRRVDLEWVYPPNSEESS